MANVPRKLPPHLHRQVSRHGKPCWYFRRGHGPRVRIPGDFGSAEFLAAYDAALAGAARAGHPRHAQAGTFAWGVALYRRSLVWSALSLATRRQRENIFKRIEASHGESKLRAWKRGDVAA